MNVWTMKKPADPSPNTAIAICATTDRSSLAITPPMCVDSQEMPRNIVIASSAITASVVAAFFA